MQRMAMQPFSCLFSGMHILWLCSWFPNPTDRFDGDFIARHAAALATIQHVHVIHLVQNHRLVRHAQPLSYIHNSGNLTEEIHLLRCRKTGLGFIDRLLFNLQYYRTYLQIIKTYIHQNGTPDLVHVHVPVKAAVVARWLLKKWRIPYVITEHSSAYHQSIPQSYQHRNWFFRLQTRAAFQHAAAVSSVSYSLLYRLQQLFALQHIRMIRNCVDTNIFFPVAKESVRQQFRFIHVSMLVPLKNVAGILQAFQQLLQVTSDCELVVVGPATDTLRQQAIDLGIDEQVQWTGLLEYAAVAKQLQQADVLVHFSDYENLPCVINEALCCGIPVISSEVGGITELINDSNGMLVPPKDIKALTEAMIQIRKQYQEYNRNAIAAAAANAFCYETIGSALLEWYQNVTQPVNSAAY